MKKNILIPITIALMFFLSIAVAATDDTVEETGEARTLVMSDEYLAKRERDLNTPFESRNTIIVDQFGGGDYTTIQEAINNSSDGTTIQVNAGVYYENLNIGCSGNLHLKGAGMDASTIQGLGTPLNVECTSGGQNIRISGFTFNTLNNSSAEAMIKFYRTNSSSSTYIVEQCKFPSGSDEHSIWIRSYESYNGEDLHGIFVIRNNIFAENSTSIKANSGYHAHNCQPDLYIYNNVFHDSDWAIRYEGSAFSGVIEISNNIFYNVSDDIYLYTSSWNHWIRYNARYNGSVSYDYFPLNNVDPIFFDPDNGDYRISDDSPMIDAGAPDEIYNDLDGSRNNIGVYGGPYTWQSLGPIITNFQVTPDVVPQGETIRIQATGSAE